MKFRSQRGYNVVELGIVLAVVGAVMVGIWFAADRAYESGRLEQAMQQHVMLLKNIRSYYLGQANVPSGDITAALINAGVIPRDMLDASLPSGIGHAWAGRTDGDIVFEGDPDTYTFKIFYNDIPGDSCPAFLTRATSGAPAEGLLAPVVVGGTDFDMLPINPSDVFDDCAGGADIEMTYRLRLPVN